jgi:hypothetical protein
MNFRIDLILRAILNSSLLFAVTLCWALAFGSVNAGYSQDDKLQERRYREAISLFSVFLSEKNLQNESIEDADRCSISNKWLDYPISEEDAREFFGVSAHAELSAPATTIFPAQILDPKKNHVRIFCNPDETQADAEKRIAEYKNAFPSGKLELSINQWEFSFPIFNKNYTRAEFVVRSGGQSWYNPHEKGSASGSAHAFVYKKQRKSWVRVNVALNTAGETWDLVDPPPLDP